MATLFYSRIKQLTSLAEASYSIKHWVRKEHRLATLSSTALPKEEEEGRGLFAFGSDAAVYWNTDNSDIEKICSGGWLVLARNEACNVIMTCLAKENHLRTVFVDPYAQASNASEDPVELLRKWDSLDAFLVDADSDLFFTLGI